MPPEAWRPLPLMSRPIEPRMWESRGLRLRAVGPPVLSEDEEEDDAATARAKVEDVATGRTAMIGAVTWKPGPVAEPLPKKIKGSAGWADLCGEEPEAATGPETKTEGDAAMGSETKKEGDAATGPAKTETEEEDEDGSEGASLA